MREFFKFLHGIGFRLLKLVGVVPLLRSRAVKFVWHSPIGNFSRNWYGVILVLVVVGLVFGWPRSSFDKAKELVARSPFDFKSHLAMAKAAAEESDFELAREEFGKAASLTTEKDGGRVLGLNSEFEEVRKVVFPEVVVDERIAELEERLAEMPGYRDLMLRLAILYWQKGDHNNSMNYFEKAFVLDPNGEEVKEVEKIIGS